MSSSVSRSNVLVILSQESAEPGVISSTDREALEAPPRIGQSVVLGLPSSSCFAVPFPASMWPRTPEQRRAAYEVEQFVPFDAEQLVVAPTLTTDSWLLIAVDTLAWEPQVQALEEEGTWIAAISPLASLALGELLRRKPIQETHVVLWQREDHIDVFLVEKSVIASWQWIAANPDAVRLTLDHIGANQHSFPCVAINLAKELIESVGSHSACSSLDQMILDQEEAAGIEADRIVAGHSRPLVDLRQGKLSPKDPYRPIQRPLTAAFYAMLSLVIAGCIVMAWRTRAYHAEGQRLQIEQEKIFTELFPHERVPVGVLTRLESEYRRLAGTKGLSANETPETGSVVPVLHTFLTSMPSGPRYKWDLLQFASEELVLATGSARSFNDANQVLKALRDAGLEAPPLSATKGGSGVSLRVEKAILRKPEKQEAEPPAAEKTKQ